VAQRRFRFAFLLVTPAGSQPSASDVAKLETFRQQFGDFFAAAASRYAAAETTLRRSLRLSLFPASGVLAGSSSTATVSVQTPSAAGLTVRFAVVNGNASFPASVTIPPGATSATLSYSGVRVGVEDVTAMPGDPAYETAFARLQVADGSLVQLIAVSGDHQSATSAGTLSDPVVVRVSDINGLRYAGLRIAANASPGGSVSPAVGITSTEGLAVFNWTPGTAASSQLRLSIEGSPAVALTVGAGAAAPLIKAVANAASFESGLAQGAIESLLGANLAGAQTATASGTWPTSLAGVRVLVNSIAAPLLYASDTQINFYLPADTPLGTATVTVVTPSGAMTSTQVTVAALQPGIFPGAIVHAGSAISAVTTPVRAGEYIEIYCTGLGATQLAGGLQNTIASTSVSFGGIDVKPVYSGLAPGYSGLYQVDVQVPEGLAPGMVPVVVSANLFHSLSALIAAQ
jgi:uncharacterized protein (TIGR03437 family)